jgi:hypothetical protein
MYKFKVKKISLCFTSILSIRDWVTRKYFYMQRILRHTGVDKTDVCYSCDSDKCYRCVNVRFIKITSKYSSMYKNWKKKLRRRHVNLYHALYSSVLAMQSIWSQVRMLRIIHLSTGLTVEACIFWIWKAYFKYIPLLWVVNIFMLQKWMTYLIEMV